MQVPPTLDMAILGVPGLLIGLVFGYYFGGYEKFKTIDRIGMGIITSIFAGVITIVAMMEAINYQDNLPLTIFEGIFIILSYFGGYSLGALSNWAPTPEKAPKSHIIIEPDDDDEEFDREIEDALTGKY